MNLNLDPRKPDQNLRGAVILPHGTGKAVRVAVFARGDRAKEAEAAGAESSEPRISLKRCRRGRSISTERSRLQI